MILDLTIHTVFIPQIMVSGVSVQVSGKVGAIAYPEH